MIIILYNYMIYKIAKFNINLYIYIYDTFIYT